METQSAAVEDTHTCLSPIFLELPFPLIGCTLRGLYVPQLAQQASQPTFSQCDEPVLSGKLYITSVHIVPICKATQPQQKVLNRTHWFCGPGKSQEEWVKPDSCQTSVDRQEERPAVAPVHFFCDQ